MTLWEYCSHRQLSIWHYLIFYLSDVGAKLSDPGIEK